MTPTIGEFVVVSCIFGFHFCYDCCRQGCVFFFFKQKTAYEMRISDWSSDVCSSDLGSKADWKARLTGDNHEPLYWGWALQFFTWALAFVGWVSGQIGRASCRERVCQYV